MSGINPTILRNKLKPKHINTAFSAGALLLFIALTGSAQAQTSAGAIAGTLENYFRLITQAPSPTDSAIFKDASGYWLKGAPGNHVGVARFFLLHASDEWAFEKMQSAGDYAAIEVSFNSVNYTQPWRTRFELVRAESSWKITEFEDLTIRPFDDIGASPAELVMAYLGTMQSIIRSDEEQDPAEAERIKRFYQPGAGFWKGPVTKALPLYLWLKQQSPERASIESVEEEGQSSLVTVRFARTNTRYEGNLRRIRI